MEGLVMSSHQVVPRLNETNKLTTVCQECGKLAFYRLGMDTWDHVEDVERLPVKAKSQRRRKS